MSTDRLATFNSALRSALHNRGALRSGQVYFNTLHDLEPTLADAIRGTMDDPFYDDGRIPEFMGVVCYRLGGRL